MANYFSGKYGRLRMTGFADTLFTLTDWEYEIDKSLIDITNFQSRKSGNAAEQRIGNLYQGTITGTGVMTDTLKNVITNNQLRSGQEVVMDLFFYYGPPANIGFVGIDAIIDNLSFSVSVQGTATVTITAKLNIPKL